VKILREGIIVVAIVVVCILLALYISIVVYTEIQKAVEVETAKTEARREAYHTMYRMRNKNKGIPLEYWSIDDRGAYVCAEVTLTEIDKIPLGGAPSIQNRDSWGK
jgi:flagellar basal body-associated protein FliL